MATEESLNHSMNKALKHYSSLFFLPSFLKAFSLITFICVCGVGFSTFFLFPSLNGLVTSLLLSFSIIVAVLFSDYVVSKVILRDDPIYVLRRTAALSLFCWVLWLSFIIIGFFLGLGLGKWWWIMLSLLGFAAVLTFRFVVFASTSSLGTLRRLFSSLLQPLLCLASFVIFWNGFDTAIPLRILPFLIASPILGFISTIAFLSLLDRLGRRMYGVPSMSIFRAFMLNWVVGLNAPFEKFLDELGETKDIEVSLLKFDSSKPKAAIIIPLVHPGPFKNIGSSLLPSIFKHEFEKEFGCDTGVMLGLLGHELDLTSQEQNYKIVKHVIASANFDASEYESSPFVRTTIGFASASCQIFGKTAFLSFTLAPKTTEDLPQQLGQIVQEEANKYGLDCVIIANAHNSIDDSSELSESLETLGNVASACLKKAKSSPTSTFFVGSSTAFPKEFTLKDGMGPGGITAIVVKVAEQKTAYVIIDGNNIISGLREKILFALTEAGFDDGEVFTTDTHAVSAVVVGRRGYHPIGEVMDHSILIKYIQDIAKKASSNLEPVKAGCLRTIIPKVRVIGKTRLESLTLLIDNALKKAKQIVVPIFAFEGLLLILALALI